MHKRRAISRQVVQRGLLLIVFLLLLYVVLSQVGGLAHAWRAALNADKALLLAAVALLAGTYIVVTMGYMLLALRGLPFWLTLRVQLAGALAGKLLPAGLGVISLNARYLQKSRYRAADVATVVGMNGIIGFAGFVIMTAIAVVGFHLRWPDLPVHVLSFNWALAIAAMVLAALIVIALLARSVRRRLRHAGRDLLANMHVYAHHPLRLVAALALATILPALFMAILYASAHALNAGISWATAFAAYAAGLGLGTATPTPGGVLGAEAGLTAALVAYGLTAEQSLLVALLYRFVIYWLPFAPGAAALWSLPKRLA